MAPEQPSQQKFYTILNALGFLVLDKISIVLTCLTSGSRSFLHWGVTLFATRESIILQIQ